SGRPRVIDVFVRTNVRLVDRRGEQDRDTMLAGIIARGEKTLVYTLARAHSVEMAQNLRTSTGRDVAYYHGGLPMRVREVLEQMFADGKIGVMVVADGLDETAVPGDVRQVALLGLPQTAAELVEQIGTAGMDGRSSQATLLYAKLDLEAARASLAERNPTRDMLTAIYRAVREHVVKDKFASWPDPGLTEALGAVASPRVIGIGLDVLAEAGVIQREYEGEHWRITLTNSSRRELSTSLRYAEGEREREALAELEHFAFGPLSEILKAVAGPTAGIRDQGTRISKTGETGKTG
ncbi:MAG TPA: helicase-related protein, partial [bacterium]|nr:helicase-related protein [bacterium]